MPPRLPPQAFETAHEKLKAFRAVRASRSEWKTFKLAGANENMIEGIVLPHKFEKKLTDIMEGKVRLPCVVCQSHKGVLYCCITYSSKLSQKEKLLTGLKLKPPIYFAFFANETVFFTTRALVPEVIAESLVDLFGAIRLKKLPLEGKDIMSLRQLYYNKEQNGKLSRRPVQGSHPVNDLDSSVEEAQEDNIIEDEDQPWKKEKQQYYNQHFYPKEDPTITKFTISSSSKFAGGHRSSRQLDCDMKVTIRTENLLHLFDYTMDRGILSYPLNPFFENVVNLGRTSISINSQKP